jgi:hypothetical protein
MGVVTYRDFRLKLRRMVVARGFEPGVPVAEEAISGVATNKGRVISRLTTAYSERIQGG